MNQWAPDEFQETFIHISQIEQASHTDLQELKQSYPLLHDTESYNTSQILTETISASLSHPEQKSLTNILQSLLLTMKIAPSELRDKYLRFIDTIVAQIGFSGRGIIPDFTVDYKHAVSEIVENMVDVESEYDLLKELRYYKEKCTRFENQSEFTPLRKSNDGMDDVLKEIELSQKEYEDFFLDQTKVNLCVL